jgi:Zn-dependent peptidase ImmA (M78 family)
LVEASPDITQYARRLLLNAMVDDRLPTPVEDIVACAGLTISPEGLSKQKMRDVIGHTPDLLRSILKKVLGMVDLRENIIYLNAHMYPQQCTFTTFHETGHKVLPWQHNTYLYLDDQTTLDPGTHLLFEREANQFAADVLFQIDRFDKEAYNLPLTIVSPLALAPRYGASAHASIRRYVERNRFACALCVVERSSFERMRGAMPRVRSNVQSPAFTSQFGAVNWNTYVRTCSSFLKSIMYPHRYQHEECVISDREGLPVPCSFEVFTNSYDTLILLQPHGATLS